MSAKLAPHGLAGRPNNSQRVITRELAEKFAAILLSDFTHNVQSASDHVGLRARTVHEAIRRYNFGKCTTAEDEEICGILASAKEQHIHKLRQMGFASAVRDKNAPGAAWVKWQLEVQDPTNHPRNTDAATAGDLAQQSVRSLKEMSVEELQDIIRGKQVAATAEVVGDTEAEEVTNGQAHDDAG